MKIQKGWVCVHAATGENHRSQFVLVHPETGEGMGVIVNGYGHMDDAPELEMGRFCLEPHTFENGVLSDNPFHKDYAAWYADQLADVSRYCGVPVSEFREALCSADPVKQFYAYSELVGYFGLENFDSYPDWFKDGRGRRILRRTMRRWEEQARLVENGRRALGVDMPFAILADWYQDKGEDKAAALLRGR